MLIFSMVCIQQELNEMGMVADTKLPYDPTDMIAGNAGTALDSSIENNNPCQGRWTAAGAFGMGGGGGVSGGGSGGGGGGVGKTTGFIDNIFGCMRPLLGSFAYKSSVIETSSHKDPWEIPFEHIFDMEFVGSGAQGTVFSGKYRNEIVAVKKVRVLKETDIKHLRKLDHENIIKFK